MPWCGRTRDAGKKTSHHLTKESVACCFCVVVLLVVEYIIPKRCETTNKEETLCSFSVLANEHIITTLS